MSLLWSFLLCVAVRLLQLGRELFCTMLLSGGQVWVSVVCFSIPEASFWFVTQSLD
jgi:hypothetical protein